MKKEAIEAAIDHGIGLLSGKVEGAVIPYDDSVFVLKQFLIALGSGQLAVAPAVQDDGNGPVVPPSPNGSGPKKKTPRKKTPRKKTSRKKS